MQTRPQQKRHRYMPVPNGYLGICNCLQCRFFITGGPFIGGLTNLANEISLECNIISKKLSYYKIQQDNLEIEELECNRKGIKFDKSDVIIELENSYTSDANKLNSLLEDLVSCVRYINQATQLANGHEKSNKIQLIVTGEEYEVETMLEEVSSFRQLSEICRRSDFYISANPDRAIPLRSQLIDRLAECNGISPFLFKYTQEEQLKIGNQFIQLLLSRLNDWDTVDKVVDGKLQLIDFGIEADDLKLETLKKVNMLSHKEYKKLKGE